MPFVNIALISILMVNEMNEAKKGFTRNLNIVDFFIQCGPQCTIDCTYKVLKHDLKILIFKWCLIFLYVLKLC